MIKTLDRVLKIGDRVRVVSIHRWLPERNGTIKEVENRIGNRFLVKFDKDELGMWHDEDGAPMLRLGEDDLIFIEEGLRLAA